MRGKTSRNYGFSACTDRDNCSEIPLACQSADQARIVYCPGEGNLLYV